MSLFNNIKTDCSSFIYKIKEEAAVYLPMLSLYENIYSSYDLVLNDKQKISNSNYNNTLTNFNSIKTKIQEKEKAILELKDILKDFEELYFKKDTENELKILEKKVFIRTREKELEDIEMICEKIKNENKELARVKEELVKENKKADIEMQNTIDEHVLSVTEKNIEDLKNKINNFSEQYLKNENNLQPFEFDYAKTQEYLQAAAEYKAKIKKLYYFYDFLVSEVKNFIEKSDFSKAQQELLKINENIKKNNIKIIELEEKIEKVNYFDQRKAEIESELLIQKTELEKLKKLTDSNEEVIKMSNLIRNFINKQESAATEAQASL
ncbi:MAG: hypothetical protein M1475_03535 [Actinobacteria bacterium]|nr:hypothetical protein [Actinomycetota bacterium]MCL6087462.1 hypothetical protein [Actinomycetota bacterium]